MSDFLPYARPCIDEDDIAAVAAVMRSGWLAHGPTVGAFERAFAEAVGAPEAVACSSGTAALQLALAATGVGEDDTVIAPSITFLSTATAARMLGAEVTFADVDPETGLMTPQTLAEAVARSEGRPRVALPVHLGGRLCDMAALADAAAERELRLVEDAAHALGSVGPDGAAGDCAHSEAACFSLHAIKTVAAGEGGMVAVRDASLAERMRRLRNHAVTHDPSDFVDPTLSMDAEGARNPWSYEQQALGFNLRMDEMSAALGLSQLRKLSHFKARRQALSRGYDTALAPLSPMVRPVATPERQEDCLHLYQVLIDFEAAGVSRSDVMRRMAERGVGTQVHYIPVHRQPYFRSRCGDLSLPGAEAFYARVLALPLWPGMADADVGRVVEGLSAALG